MSPALHPVSRKIIDMLEAQGCWYETFRHQAVRTSEEAAAARPGYGLNQGAKAIILRVKPLLCALNLTQ